MFRAHRVFSLLQPRRPRHPLIQALLAMFAICAFVALLAVGAIVAMMALVVAALARALGFARPMTFRVGTPAQPPPDLHAAATGARGDIIDGEFRVVDKSIPHGPPV